MKTTNIIICVLAAVVVTLSIILFRTLQDDRQYVTSTKEVAQFESEKTSVNFSERSFSSSLQLDKELHRLLCNATTIQNDGEEIKADSAKKEIAAFEAHFGADDVKAFHLGLVTLDSMLTKAKRYNKTPAGIQSPIKGLRFYRAISTRIMPGGLPVTNKFDLVIYPTLSMDVDLTTGPIYGHTRPCPRLCK
ncbi:hypothetical protein [Fluviicola sp.]|uniref:hypothetical protein n=1 Tax=Fluviicola sp. TaxID=1917219 RepID=UPI0031CDFC42